MSSPKAPAAPPPPPPVPVREDDNVLAAGVKEAELAAKRRGRKSTIRTLLSEDTSAQGKTLLGS